MTTSLEAVLGFTAIDLDHNRRGELSPAQAVLDGADDEVLVAEGRAQFVRDEPDDLDGDGNEGGGSAPYSLFVAGEQFLLSREQFDAFAAGHLYRVYHRRGVEALLSAEYLGPPPDELGS